MDESKMHIDDLFRSKEQPFVLLPATAWEDMKLRLDHNQPKNGFPGHWIWYALLLLIVLGISFYLLRSHPKDRQNIGNKYSVPSVSQENSRNTTSANSPTTSLKQSDIPLAIPAKVKRHNQSPGQERTGGDTRLSGAAMGLPRNGADKQVTLPVPARLRSRHESFKNDTAKVKTIVEPAAPLTSKVPTRPTSEVSPMPHLVDVPDATLLPLPVKKAGAMPWASREILVPSTRSTSSELLLVHKNTATHLVNDTITSSLWSAAPTPIGNKPSAQERNNIPVLNTRPGEKDSLSIPKNGKRLPIAFGFKAGYAAGTSKPSVNKLLIAPYLQYELGNRFSLILQPTLKYGTFVGAISPNEKSYYHATGTTVDSQTISKNGHPFWQITYTHGYDSITVQSKPTRNTIEMELPLILQYHLKQGIFFNAGLDLLFGNLIGIEEQKQTTPRTQTAVFQIEKAGTHPPPDTSQSFHHSVPPYSAYIPLERTTLSPLRVGYLLGVGYEHKKWLVEGYLQQNVYGLSGITQPDIKKAYQIPYLHFMLGYRLSKK